MRIVKPAIVRKQEVLDAAMRLFATRGYDNTSVNDVIAAIGISKGAFYHHFASKEDLVEALAFRYAAEAAVRAQGVLDDASLDCFERLSRFLSRMRDDKVEMNPEFYAAFAPVFRPENIALYERTREACNAVIRPLLVRIVTEGVAEKTFDTPDPEAAVEVILHLMGSTRPIAADLYAARTPAEIDRQIARLMDRLRYLGTVIDRILGIPEGSIELTGAGSAAEISRIWHKAAVA
jgi:AcrR family transcriptional regulator